MSGVTPALRWLGSARNGLLLAAWLALVTALAALWHAVDASSPSRPSLVRSSAIVMLAGNNADRVPLAARLFRAGLAPRIILTNDGVRHGWSSALQRNVYSIERAEMGLRELGVPAGSIVSLPFKKSGTVHDALAVRDYVVGAGLTGNLIVVTSDYHLPRSAWIFRKVLPPAFGIIPVAAPARGPMFARRVKEGMKYLWYRVRFGAADFGPV